MVNQYLTDVRGCLYQGEWEKARAIWRVSKYDPTILEYLLDHYESIRGEENFPLKSIKRLWYSYFARVALPEIYPKWRDFAFSHDSPASQSTEKLSLKFEGGGCECSFHKISYFYTPAPLFDESFLAFNDSIFIQEVSIGQKPFELFTHIYVVLHTGWHNDYLVQSYGLFDVEDYSLKESFSRMKDIAHLEVERLSNLLKVQ